MSRDVVLSAFYEVCAAVGLQCVAFCALLCLSLLFPTSLFVISAALNLRGITPPLYAVTGCFVHIATVLVVVLIPVKLSRWASASRWLPSMLVIACAMLALFAAIQFTVPVQKDHEAPIFVFLTLIHGGQGEMLQLSALFILPMLLAYGVTCPRTFARPRLLWPLLSALCYLIAAVFSSLLAFAILYFE